MNVDITSGPNMGTGVRGRVRSLANSPSWRFRAAIVVAAVSVAASWVALVLRVDEARARHRR